MRRTGERCAAVYTMMLFAGISAPALAYAGAPEPGFNLAIAEGVPQTLSPSRPPAQPPAGPVQQPIAPTAGTGDDTQSADSRRGAQPAPAQQAKPPAAPPTEAPVVTARQVEAGVSAINPTGRDIDIVVPLRDNGPLGQVQMHLSAAGVITVSADDLVNAVRRIVKPATLTALQGAALGGAVSLEAAARAGLPLSYDPSASELLLQLPISSRLNQTLSLGSEAQHATVAPDKSSRFAAFLNYRAGAIYEITGPLQGKTGAVADLQFSGRVFGVAFENFATVDQLADHTFVRIASRLIYDVPGPALRITAGDLFTETTVFQSDPQIAGLNFSHLISTFYPSSTVSGRSNRSLTLASPATVEILVNGAPLTQLRLGPGTYDLRDFPLAQGSNNVQAVVTDDAGERRVLNFSFFSDSNLLTPGFDEYTASIGVLAPLGDNGPRYQTNQPLLSGFYRRGLNEQLTAGFNIQASRFNQIFGLDAVFGAPFGLVAADLAVNHLENGETGEAFRLQYRYASHTDRLAFARTFDASVELRSRRFADVNQQDANNSEEALFAVNFNQPIGGRLSVSLSGNYLKSRVAGQDSAGASAFLTWQAPLETTLGLGVAYQYAPKSLLSDQLTGRGFSIAATLTHRFGQRSIVNATADRFRQRIDYTRSPTHPTNDYAVSADISHTDFGYAGSAAGAYETNRGNIQAQYSGAFLPNGTVTNQAISTTFDGSVAFADGTFALGRRITDSFAILAGHPSLNDKQVLVESRFADDVVAKSGFFGPALVPITSYQRQVIPYDVKDLPPGYDLGTSNFELYPWLHSGFALTIGSDYNLTSIGDLLDADGAPVALRVGTAVSLTDRKAPKLEVITNRTGRFALLGMSPGRWRITLPGDPALSYDLTVAAPLRNAPQAYLVRVGELRPTDAAPAATGR